MPRRKRKGITPFDVLDAFCKFTFNQPAKTVIKNFVFHGTPPVESDDISEEQVGEVMEDIFGEGFFEDEQFVSQEEREEINDDGVEFDGEFYRFDRKPRHRKPKTQRVASEYAEWFRIQGERARAKARGEEYDETAEVEDGMPGRRGVPSSRGRARRGPASRKGRLPTAGEEVAPGCVSRGTRARGGRIQENQHGV
jgi:hypothetical protein